MEGGGTKIGQMSVQLMGKTFIQTFFDLILNILTGGAVTMEAGSLFQYSTTIFSGGGP